MSESTLTEKEENILHLLQRQAHIQCIIEELSSNNTPESLGNMETIFGIALIVEESLTKEQQAKIEDRLEKGLFPGGEFY